MAGVSGVFKTYIALEEIENASITVRLLMLHLRQHINSMGHKIEYALNGTTILLSNG